MEPEQTVAGTHHTFHALHLTPEDLAQLSPDELLQACLEYHRLLQTIMGILTTPDARLTMRVVAIDLLYAQALQISQEKTPDVATQVVAIKHVSERLGLRPHEVRTAYEQIEALGGLHIIDKRFLPRRPQQKHLPFDTPPTDQP
jgi:hypothetical protein